MRGRTEFQIITQDYVSANPYILPQLMCQKWQYKYMAMDELKKVIHVNFVAKCEQNDDRVWLLDIFTTEYIILLKSNLLNSTIINPKVMAMTLAPIEYLVVEAPS